jgi:hypothetical protein
MIHHLSHPTHNSVNDFIASEFCTVKYASIDDAVSLVQRIGKMVSLQKLILKALSDYLESFQEILTSWSSCLTINTTSTSVFPWEPQSVVRCSKNCLQHYIG